MISLKPHLPSHFGLVRGCAPYHEYITRQEENERVISTADPCRRPGKTITSLWLNVRQSLNHGSQSQIPRIGLSSIFTVHQAVANVSTMLYMVDAHLLSPA